MDLTPTEVRKGLSKTSRLIGELGRLLRRRTVLEAKRDERVQRIKEYYNPQVDALETQIADKVDELMAHVLPRFAFLRYQKTKSVRTLNGSLAIRRNPVAVDYDKKEEEAIIRRIRRRGLSRKFLRRGKYTLDKEAIAAHPELAATIKGLHLVNRTTVTVKPSKVDVKPYKQDVDSIKVTLPEEED